MFSFDCEQGNKSRLGGGDSLHTLDPCQGSVPHWLLDLVVVLVQRKKTTLFTLGHAHWLENLL